MAKPKLTTTFLITVEHEKPIPDLIDLVAGRAYTIDGVSNATATSQSELVAAGAALLVNIELVRIE